MATHSSVLAWRIPGTGEPGGLPSMGSHRVGHDWSDLAITTKGFLKVRHQAEEHAFPGLPVAAVCRDGSEKQHQVRQQNCPGPLQPVVQHTPPKRDCSGLELWLLWFRRHSLCCQQEKVCCFGLQGFCTWFTMEDACEARIQLLFSHSVLSYSLRHHGLQHTRLPCPSLSPQVCSNACPLSRWFHPTISSSVTSFSSCPQSFPASGSFPVSQLFICRASVEQDNVVIPLGT